MSQSLQNPDFEASVAYWDSVEASVNGVLGGFGLADSPVPLLDALSSRMFLLGCAPRLSAIAPPTSVRGVPKKRSSPIKALDVGAGVGRITKDVLLPFCQHVDLVESSSHFLDQAVKDLSVPQVDCSIRFFLNGMQYFNPELPQGLHASHLLDQSLADRKYDIVWLQWAAGYLNDDQLVAFLQRCRHALSTPTEEDPEGGLIIVKENITRIAVYHDEDSSITRTDKDFHRCFKRAGLDVVKEEVQKGFPEGLFVVRTYALRPQNDVQFF